MTLDDDASRRQHQADLDDEPFPLATPFYTLGSPPTDNIRRTGDITEVIDLLWAILRRLDDR